MVPHGFNITTKFEHHATILQSVMSRNVKIVFFLKIDYHLLKIDFFSIIVSDVTVTGGWLLQSTALL